MSPIARLFLTPGISTMLLSFLPVEDLKRILFLQPSISTAVTKIKCSDAELNHLERSGHIFPHVHEIICTVEKNVDLTFSKVFPALAFLSVKAIYDYRDSHVVTIDPDAHIRKLELENVVVTTLSPLVQELTLFGSGTAIKKLESLVGLCSLRIRGANVWEVVQMLHYAKNLKQLSMHIYYLDYQEASLLPPVVSALLNLRNLHLQMSWYGHFRNTQTLKFDFPQPLESFYGFGGRYHGFAVHVILRNTKQLEEFGLDQNWTIDTQPLQVHTVFANGPVTNHFSLTTARSLCIRGDHSTKREGVWQIDSSPFPNLDTIRLCLDDPYFVDQIIIDEHKHVQSIEIQIRWGSLTTCHDKTISFLGSFVNLRKVHIQIHMDFSLKLMQESFSSHPHCQIWITDVPNLQNCTCEANIPITMHVTGIHSHIANSVRRSSLQTYRLYLLHQLEPIWDQIDRCVQQNSEPTSESINGYEFTRECNEYPNPRHALYLMMAQALHQLIQSQGRTNLKNHDIIVPQIVSIICVTSRAASIYKRICEEQKEVDRLFQQLRLRYRRCIRNRVQLVPSFIRAFLEILHQRENHKRAKNIHHIDYIMICHEAHTLFESIAKDFRSLD